MNILTLGLYLSAGIFCLGLLITIVKKQAIFVLIGIELMLNAANLNFVIFSQNDITQQGELVAIFSLVLATTEIIIGLAILLLVSKHFYHIDFKKINNLKH